MNENINKIIDGVDEVINSAKRGDFDEVLAKTKSYASKATKRSAERLEISKKKIELLEAKSKLAKAYEKYGKLQYAIHEGEDVAEESVKAALAEIQLHKTRADYIDDELDELRELFARPEENETPAEADVTVEDAE